VEVEGEERWLSISAVRFPGGTVYAFRDVTDERAVEQMKTDFVSTVSHELRTPLAAIYGAAMTLQRRDVVVEEPQRDRLLEVVSSEADRLARIVNDILWASRLESGRMSIAIERCDAGTLASEVVDILRSRAPEGIEVEISKSRGLPPVAADPDKLRQRRGAGRATRRAGSNLREVLPARPEPHAGRRRHGPRALHHPRARDAHARPRLGRLGRPQRFLVLPRAADRLNGAGADMSRCQTPGHVRELSVV
jgi:hypothetical protein